MDSVTTVLRLRWISISDTNKVLKELSQNVAIVDITSVDPSSATGTTVKAAAFGSVIA